MWPYCWHFKLHKLFRLSDRIGNCFIRLALVNQGVVLHAYQAPWPWNSKGPWEINIHCGNWWALKFSVKWKWTMLRDHNISSCLDPGHDFNVIFIGANGNFALNRQLFGGPSAIFSRLWNIIHVLPCRMPCRFPSKLKLVPHAFKI